MMNCIKQKKMDCEGVMMKLTYHNPCDDLYASLMYFCGSERGNEPSRVFWWSAHPWPVFGSAVLSYRRNAIKTGAHRSLTKRGYRSKRSSHDSRLTRVCVGNLVGFIRIQPDLLLATAQDTGCQALLEPEHAWEGGKKMKQVKFGLT